MASALDNRIPPPALTMIIAAAMGGAAWFVPPIAIPDFLRYAATGVLFLIGGLFGAPAFAAFARAGTTINPVRIEDASALVTTGIYRVSRNPMYVGLTMLLLTLAVFLSRPLLLIGPVAFVGYITRFQIIPEERVMSAKFGDAYAAYRRRVRRWV